MRCSLVTRAKSLSLRRSRLMPGARLELARCRQRWILSPLRLPIPPSRHSNEINDLSPLHFLLCGPLPLFLPLFERLSSRSALSPRLSGLRRSLYRMCQISLASNDLSSAGPHVPTPRLAPNCGPPSVESRAESYPPIRLLRKPGPMTHGRF